MDDAKLHQYVNSKTQQPIEFSYQPFRTENMEIGVIEIPIQERPIYLKRGFGIIKKNDVYKRDGSSTAIATPDEIVKMGAKQDSGGTPQLVLEWADIKRRVPLPSPHTVNTLSLNPQLSDDTFEKPHSIYSSPIDNAHDNKNYSREIILYTYQMAFLKSFGLRLFNDSGVVGKRVRFVGSVAKDNASSVLDDQPERPYRKTMDKITDLMRQQHRSNPYPCVRELADRWEITIEFGDVRPREEIWTTSALLIGPRNGITRLEGKLQGDNIPEPISCILEINFEVEVRPMERSDVEPYLDSR